jgi:hypothetical protein
VILVAVVYLPVKEPVPLPVLPAVLPLQVPPESVAATFVAVLFRIWLVFVKSQVPTLVCGPWTVTVQPARVTLIVQLKSLSRATIPVPEGAAKAVSLSVALPAQVTVAARPNAVHLPPFWPKLRATERDDVPLAGVVPLASAVVQEMVVPEYLRALVVELPVMAVDAGVTSAIAALAFAANAPTITRPSSTKRLIDIDMKKPLSNGMGRWLDTCNYG